MTPSQQYFSCHSLEPKFSVPDSVSQLWSYFMKLGDMVFFGGNTSEQSVKVFPMKILSSANSRKFSPLKVSRYTVFKRSQKLKLVTHSGGMCVCVCWEGDIFESPYCSPPPISLISARCACMINVPNAKAFGNNDT